MTTSLFPRAHACLVETAIDVKLSAVSRLWDDWCAGTLDCDDAPESLPIDEPGRPARPRLVPPTDVRKRGIGTPAGRAALIHAIAHIEWNAISLALDAAHRFRGLPRNYYHDWLHVAAEEAAHFQLLSAHLKTMGFSYGDFDAHDGLWEMARRTAHDPLARMALVPRLLEARGLDVTPAISARLRRAGDTAAVAILDVILRDEIGHVAIGNHWYAQLCKERGVNPIATFERLLSEHGGARLRGPFHFEARRKAGFTDEEMSVIERFAAENEERSTPEGK